MLREATCLQLAERLFQSFAPLNKKYFLPFAVPFFGILRSVDVLRSLYEVLCECEIWVIFQAALTAVRFTVEMANLKAQI